MSPSPAVDSSMTPIVRQLLKQVARSALRAVWTVTLLAILVGIGYVIGERLGLAQGNDLFRWYGAGGGLLVWIVFRPKHRRRGSRGSSAAGRTTTYHDETYVEDGSWFGGNDSGSDSDSD